MDYPFRCYRGCGWYYGFVPLANKSGRLRYRCGNFLECNALEGPSLYGKGIWQLSGCRQYPVRACGLINIWPDFLRRYSYFNQVLTPVFRAILYKELITERKLVQVCAVSGGNSVPAALSAAVQNFAFLSREG